MSNPNGNVVVEWHTTDEPETSYRLSDDGTVCRMVEGDGRGYRPYMTIMKHAIPTRVAHLRFFERYVITNDCFVGRAPRLEVAETTASTESLRRAPQSSNRDKEVSRVTKTTTKSSEPKQPKMGAKASKLLDSFDLGKESRSKTEERAKQIAEERGDRIVRRYYIYLALDKEMPDGVRQDFEYFQQHGKEKSSEKNGKSEKAKSASAPAEGKTASRTVVPDPKEKSTSGE